MSDLQELLATRVSADPASILIALREGLSADPADSGPAAELHALLTGYFAINDMAINHDHRKSFKRHPDAAQKLLAMLEQDGEHAVADLMRSLIEGKPRPTGALEQGLRGPGVDEAAKHGPGIVAALKGFADVALASPESATEMELSLGWSAVEEGLLDRVERHVNDLAFTHGPTHTKAAARTQQLDALVAQMGIAAMLDAIIAAKNPRVIARATEWDIKKEGAPAGDVEVAIAHRLHKARLGPATRLESMPGASPLAVAQLLALYRCTNGGELFIPVSHAPSEHGLQFIADSDWDAEREHMMVWLTMGGEEPPVWAQTLVPFAMLPGDASRWVVPIEGPYAGAVMLSNDDVHEEHVRYKSLAHFIAALRLCPQEILSNGGYVSYLPGKGDYLLYPEGWREDA